MQRSEINFEKIKNSHQDGNRKVNQKDNNTFDNFVLGDCNKLARGASISVSQNPGKEYNPLYIWGDTGLGKTHLLFAIKNCMNELYPEKSILYVDAECFVKEVVNSIRYGTMTEFREKYRTVDVLLMDNLQDIIGKKSTQEEFFHTFNSLFEVGKQIVITADKPPKEMSKLDEKFKSRLSHGLIIDIQLPDLNTRKEVVLKLAQSQKIGIDEEAINYIATNVSGSITQLVDIMNKVIFESEHSKGETRTELVVRVIEEIKKQENKKITLKMIIDSVAEYFKITSDDILSVKRSKEVLYPRLIAMYLCTQLTNETLSSIGKTFGKNHRTIKNGMNKIELKRNADSEISKEIEIIKNRLLGAE